MMIGMTPPAFSLETWPVGWRASDLNDELTRLTTQLSLVATPSTDGVLYANASQQLIDAAWHVAGFTQSSINADPAKRGKTYNRPSIAARNGVRQNSATRYLLPVRERVTIQTDATVTRLLISNGTALGVKWADTSNRSSTAVAWLRPGGKLVLTAGALATPRLLQLSGIGHRACRRAHAACERGSAAA